MRKANLIGIGLGLLTLIACGGSDEQASSSSGGPDSGTTSGSSSSSGGSSSGSSSGAPATFSIGGEVSGLSGTVVLQNSGGDDLTINASGAFTFKTPIASGAAYAVTVKTQPTSPVQTCSVSNGSGTATAAVTNVKVVCSTTAFSVSAAVSGLNGTVVLQNNGADDLATNINGVSPFTAKVASGSPYAVTVKTHPATQFCSVTNGSGTITNANVTANVACVEAYVVGGKVVDLLGPLTGSGLVLRNNAGSNLPITQVGPFAFGTRVPGGAPYAVTVFTQPSTPARTCTVANGAGTVAAADISDVVVTCGWGAIPAFGGGGEVNPGTGQFNGFGTMVWDENGDILLPPGQGASLRRLSRATGTVADVGGQFPVTGYYLGLAYNPATKIAYVGHTGTSQIYTYDLANAGNAAVVLTSVTGGPHNLAIAPASFGALGGYIAALTDSSSIVFVDPANPATKVTYALPSNANGIAFSSGGTLYIQRASGQIVTMTPDGVMTPFATVGTSCDGIALDEGRNLMYVAVSGASRTRKISLADGTAIADVAGSINYDGGYWPSPILFDGVGTLIAGITSSGLKLVQQPVP